jgi:hypothetical protein
MRIRISLSCAAGLLLAGGLAGCVTDPAASAWVGGPIRVTLSPGGTLSVAGQQMDAPTLARTLKRRRVLPETCLQIAVPDGTSTPTLTALTQPLIAAGYRRILFTKPRHAETALGDRPAPSKTP